MTGTTADLRRELRSVFCGAGVALDPAFGDDGSLVRAGRLDSLALFELVLWVEAKTGRAVDPQAIDIAREWDTIDRIVAYVVREAGAPSEVLAQSPEELSAALPGEQPSEAWSATSAAATADPRCSPVVGSGGNDHAVRIVAYADTHKEAVARFQTGLWSADVARNLRYLEWKYESNPFATRPRMYLAYDGDDLIATRGFYASCWELGDPPCRHIVLIADDAHVDERFRNQSVMRRIMDTAFDDLHRDGVQFVFNLTGGPVTVLSSLARGWKSGCTLAPMRRMTTERKVRNGLGMALSRLPFVWRWAAHPLLRGHGQHPFRRLDRLESPLGNARHVRIAASREPRAAAMAELVGRIGHDGRLRHVRDGRWLDWRFRNPLADYRFLYAGTDRLDGYAVLRSRAGPAPGEPVHIADLEAIDDVTRSALLHAASGAVVFDEVRAWSVTLRDTDVEALARIGFLPFARTEARAAEPCVLVRPTAGEGLAGPWLLDGMPLLDPQTWDLRMLYTMAG